MPEYKIPETKVKFKDVFSLKNLYIMMHEYLLEEKWFGEEGPQKGDPSKQHRYIETLYFEKYCQKGLHAGGKELWIYWRLFKRPEGKYSGYIRYRLNIDFHGVYIQDREVMHQGQKIKVQWGELELMFNGAVQTDYREEWKDHWFLKNIQDIYEKRIIEQEIEKHEKMLWREIYRLTGVIKRYLDMRVFIPTAEPIYPKLYGMEA
ncbi:MAG: hypothetical protein KKC75_03020 [Nanoarchaeota archaeon]|nr:hypothetical protein [Nanoarchaeota archaeon]MBU1004622.1 hypothetical protein [Nanoarchaeota archaeon]MBU1945514.1 hypothetical protein [Nanoarchaeota archaeon]